MRSPLLLALLPFAVLATMARVCHSQTPATSPTSKHGQPMAEQSAGAGDDDDDTSGAIYFPSEPNEEAHYMTGMPSAPTPAPTSRPPPAPANDRRPVPQTPVSNVPASDHRNAMNG